MAKIMKTIRQRRKKDKGSGANITAAERKIAKTYPGSSVRVTDTFGANITAYERLFEKLGKKKTKRPLRNGPR